VYEADPAKSRPADKPIGGARSRSSSSPRPLPCAQSRSGLRQGGPPGVERPRARLLDRSAGLPLTCAAMTYPPTSPTGERECARGHSTPTALLHSLLVKVKTPAPQPGRVRTRTTSPRFVCAQWERPFSLKNSARCCQLRCCI